MDTGSELYRSKRKRKTAITAMQVRDSLWDESLHWPESVEHFTATFRVCGLSK